MTYRKAEHPKPTGLTVCAGCLDRVLPRSDGTCPGCGNDMASQSPPTERRTTLRLIDRMPTTCIRCGTDTEETIDLETSRKVGGEHPVMALFAMVGMFFSMLFAPRTMIRSGVPRLMGERQDVRRRVPCCAACQKDGPPVIEHVDFSEKELVVRAHVRFERALRRMRKESKGA